jgi:hypothetical protein
MLSTSYATLDRVLSRAGYAQSYEGGVFIVAGTRDLESGQDWVMDMAYEGDALAFGEQDTAHRGWPFALENHLSAVLKVRTLLVTADADGAPGRAELGHRWNEYLEFIRRDDKLGPAEKRPPSCFAIDLSDIKDELARGTWPREYIRTRYPNGQWCIMLLCPPVREVSAWRNYRRASAALEDYSPVTFREGPGCVWSSLYRTGGDWCPPLCLAGGKFLSNLRRNFENEDGLGEAVAQASVVDREMSAFPRRNTGVRGGVDIETGCRNQADDHCSWENTSRLSLASAFFNLISGGSSSTVREEEPALPKPVGRPPISSNPNLTVGSGRFRGTRSPLDGEIDRSRMPAGCTEEGFVPMTAEIMNHIMDSVILDDQGAVIGPRETIPELEVVPYETPPPTPIVTAAQPAAAEHPIFKRFDQTLRLRRLAEKGEYGRLELALSRPKIDWISKGVKVQDCVGVLVQHVCRNRQGVLQDLIDIVGRTCNIESKYMKGLGLLHTLVKIDVAGNSYQKWGRDPLDSDGE